MVYWFAVDPERPDVLDVGIRNGIWGVPEDAWDRIREIGPGDEILLYHRDQGLLLCEVESEPYTENIPVWRDVDYPHRVRISDPIELDRYAHLGQLYDCLHDEASGEAFASDQEAEKALREPDMWFRPLTGDEVRCVFGRLGWALPEGIEPAQEEPEPAEEEPEPPALELEDTTAEPADDAASDAVEGAGASAGEAAEAAEPEAVVEEEDEAEEPEAVEEEPESVQEEPEPAGEAPRTVEEREPRVILMPATGNAASRERYADTIGAGVPLERMESFLSSEELGTLGGGEEDAEAYVWGAPPTADHRTRSRWEESRPGDVLLFTGEGRVFASARVVLTRRNRELARHLWGERDDGKTWEYIYFVTQPVLQDISYEEFNPVAGYDAGYRIPRLNVLDADQTEQVLEAFPGLHPDRAAEREDRPNGDRPEAAETTPSGAEEEAAGVAADVPGDPEDVDLEVTDAEGADEEERERAGTRELELELAGGESSGPDEDEPATPTAAEGGPPGPASAGREGGAVHDGRAAEMQAAREEARRHLFGDRELGRCGLCGRLFPVRLLAVVFVKRLDECTRAEMRDVPNNALPACRLGCEGLFEGGYAIVTGGHVEVGRQGPLTEPVQERLTAIVGSRCEYWHARSEEYFRWHADRARRED